MIKKALSKQVGISAFPFLVIGINLSGIGVGAIMLLKLAPDICNCSAASYLKIMEAYLIL